MSNYPLANGEKPEAFYSNNDIQHPVFITPSKFDDLTLSGISTDHSTDDPLPNDAELFEFNTPDIVSSKGRQPSDNPVFNYFPAKISEQGVDDIYDSPWSKWSGRGVIGLFKATQNLVLDPEDLTTGNWVNINSTDELTDKYINGKRLTKITNSGANAGYVKQTWTDTFGGLYLSGTVTVVKGSSAGNTARVQVYNSIQTINIFNLNIDFDNAGSSPGTPTAGKLLHYNWLGTDAIEIFFSCVVLVATTDNVFITLYGSNNTTDGEYTYFTAAQIEESTYPTPYTASSRPAGNIWYPSVMPNKFTLIKWIYPWFTFNTNLQHKFVEFALDSTHKFSIFYSFGNDKINIGWQDGGTVRYLESQQFDDGTSHDNINQWIMVAMSIDITTGTTAGSILKVYADTTGKDTSWSGNIDSKTSDFPIMNIGADLGSANHGDVLITDFLFVPDEVWTEAQLDAHHTANRPYYADNRILGVNCNFRQDIFGNAYFKNLVVR